MAEIHQYDKSTKHNNYNKTMIAEELRRYYSELKIEDDYEELRDVNSQIEEYTTDELIQKKRDILFKIKQEIKHNR